MAPKWPATTPGSLCLWDFHGRGPVQVRVARVPGNREMIDICATFNNKDGHVMGFDHLKW